MCRKLYYVVCSVVFFFKQKTAYEMRIGDGSSDVCSSDLRRPSRRRHGAVQPEGGVHVGDGSAVGFGAAAQRHALFIWRHLVDDAGTFQPVSFRKSVVLGKSVSVCVIQGGRLSLSIQIYFISTIQSLSSQLIHLYFY